MKENRVAQNKEILNKNTFQASSSKAGFLCIKIGTWQF
ncbi:hypothetical protein T07_10403 [Trichinella nelsoni]|uniref:Uncharacterized protein n=1 Tax=Trichinella nelsoni TaxID=6336 RepID=A0A0V0RBY2_9BILA|nr:hypothetical protein T07_10403 [Trichinella nelsoni]